MIFTIIGISITLGSLGAWLIMNYGSWFGTNDIPNNRSSHVSAVPKGGGIGILMALIVVSNILSIPSGLWVSAAIISIISLWGGINIFCLQKSD